MNICISYDCDYPSVTSLEDLSIRHSHGKPDELITKVQSMKLHEVLEQMSFLYADIKLFESDLKEGMIEKHWCVLQKQLCIDKQLYKLLKDKLNILKQQLLSKPAAAHEVTEFEYVAPGGNASLLEHVDESFRVFSPCNFEKVKKELQQIEKKVTPDGDGSSHDEIDLPLASNTETPANSP